MPLIYNINQNTPDAQISSPRAVIAIFPFKDVIVNADKVIVNADNSNQGPNVELTTKGPIIVSPSEILDLNITQDKNTPIGNMSCVLASAKYNYLQVCNPGDYIMIWICPSVTVADQLIDNIQKLKACNDIKFGLKFFGKIFSTEENFSINGKGVKSVRYSLTGHSFDFYQTQIFNSPFLIPSEDEDSANFFYSASFFEDVANAITDEQDSQLYNPKVPGGINFSAQLQVEYLHQAFMGLSGNKAKAEDAIFRSATNMFVLPPEVANLFGIKGQNQNSQTPIKYTDLVNVLVGVQTFDSDIIDSPFGYIKSNSALVSVGPSNFSPAVGIYGKVWEPTSTTNYLKGKRILNIAPNMGGSIWQVLEEHANRIINEMYTTLRMDPLDSNQIFPSFICRQLPMSLNKPTPRESSSDNPEASQDSFSVTMYNDLLRFRINPKNITSYSLNKSNAARLNLFFNLPIDYTPGFNSTQVQAEAIATSGYRIDTPDAIKHGLKVFNGQIYDQFPWSSSTNEPQTIDFYNDFIADINGNLHIKLTGTINTWGIYDPICIGENLQIDNISKDAEKGSDQGGIVFHIERLTHTYTVQNGLPIFRTSFDLSHGLPIDKDNNISGGKNSDGLFIPDYGNFFSNWPSNPDFLAPTRGTRFSEEIKTENSQETLTDIDIIGEK